MNAPNRALTGAPLTESLFSVEGLRCAACIARLEKGLAALEGVAAARATSRRAS